MSVGRSEDDHPQVPPHSFGELRKMKVLLQDYLGLALPASPCPHPRLYSALLWLPSFIVGRQYARDMALLPSCVFVFIFLLLEKTW